MRRNLLLAGGLVACIGGMVGMSFAAIPLYRVFCQATGYDGTPKIGPAAAPGADSRTIEVRFDANTSPGLPWRFTADVPALEVNLGEDHLATYTGQNRSAQTITGVATYNVMPDKAARYFHKTACFCFNEQTLTAGQQTSFPLSFWVDPAIASDPETRDVRTITLSYTFMRAHDDVARSGELGHDGRPVSGVVGTAVGPRADAGSSSLNPEQFSR